MKIQAFVLLALSSATALSAAPNEQKNFQYQHASSFKQTPRTIMDDEIAKNVHPIISGNWLSNGYPHVTFDVNNGTVNLRGIVDTKEEKEKIEHEVKKVEGVKAVNNQITIGMPAKSVALNETNTRNGAATATIDSAPKDSAANDKDRLINTQIREKISKWSPRGYETIVISTSNGAVTLRGSVEKVEDIQKISHDAKNVEGVKSVTNQIYVKKQ